MSTYSQLRIFTSLGYVPALQPEWHGHALAWLKCTCSLWNLAALLLRGMDDTGLDAWSCAALFQPNLDFIQSHMCFEFRSNLPCTSDICMSLQRPGA